MGPCHSGKAVLNPAYGPVFFLAAGGLMPTLKKDPLRPLSSEERLHMERLSRALGLPAALVTRAKVVLAVADGHSYSEAARLACTMAGASPANTSVPSPSARRWRSLSASTSTLSRPTSC